MTTDEAPRNALQNRRAAAARAQTATAEQLLQAANEGQTTVTQEDIFAMQQPRGAGGAPATVAERAPGMQGATVTHETASKVWMYKPTPQGYSRRLIPSNNIGMAVRSGWLAVCPDCGRSECCANGDLNDCPGRPPRMYRECPITSCVTSGGWRHRVYDPLETAVPAMPDAPPDPFAIKDDLAARSTPEERTWTELAAHLLAFHPKEAPRYGANAVVYTAPALQPQVGAQAGQR